MPPPVKDGDGLYDGHATIVTEGAGPPSANAPVSPAAPSPSDAADDMAAIAARRIQRAYRQQLHTQLRTWFAPSTYNRNDDPRAVLFTDDHYLFRFGDQWLTDIRLTSAQRRRCRSMIKDLGLPAPTLPQF
jgi:hypothetical protein